MPDASQGSNRIRRHLSRALRRPDLRQSQTRQRPVFWSCAAPDGFMGLQRALLA